MQLVKLSHKTCQKIKLNKIVVEMASYLSSVTGRATPPPWEHSNGPVKGSPASRQLYGKVVKHITCTSLVDCIAFSGCFLCHWIFVVYSYRLAYV